MALRDTIERGNADEVASAAHSLLCARHNNGVVRDKISELDTAVGAQTGRWWCRRKRVLFVCSGNTCRSPMAEAMARQILGNTFCVESAGINALDGAPANPHAIAVLAEKGLDIRGHSARRIDSVDTLTFDIIVTMDRAVPQSLRSRGVNPAIITELDISDPYGQGIESYRATANSIEFELRGIFPAS